MGLAFRLHISLDHRMKHKTLSYLSVIAVVDSRVWFSSALSSGRGVLTESLWHRTSFQLEDKINGFSVAA